MSDIFISYTREDQAWAQRLAAALEAQDWSVWWDRSIPPGTPYDATIEEQLRAARCVVVLWSRRSVESHWVRAEATDGLERKILVPVIIEETELPLAFRQIQCVELAGWKEGRDHPGLQQLVEATGRVLGAKPAAAPITPSLPRRQRLLKWAAAAALVVVAGGGTLFAVLKDDSVRRGRDGKEMVRVPAGAFRRGSTEDDAERAYTLMSGTSPELSKSVVEPEQPQLDVELSAFYIDRFEVTFEEYRSYLEDSRARQRETLGDAPGDDYPVTGVSWAEADAYCRWAGKFLPSEAQWEKAARGTQGRQYPWGNEPVNARRANYCDTNCPSSLRDWQADDGYARTAPVGSFKEGQSPYGIYDLAGNVSEWVRDWYDRDYYLDSPAIDPVNKSDAEYRVVRGGSWASSPAYLRAPYRSFKDPKTRSDEIGFRCAWP